MTTKPKQTDFYLWPPNPKKASWKSDLPNEGIHVGLSKGEGYISEFLSDYHGHIVLDSSQYYQKWVQLTLVPTKNVEYLTAYAVIMSTLARFENKSGPWDKVALAVVKGLKSLGWCEVVFDHEEGCMIRKSQLPYQAKRKK